MKILLVDDEPDILELLTYSFEIEGFDVVTANDGLEALKVAEKELPDIIILDIMMPGMDGVEVCGTLRKLDKHKDKIIVLLTGRNEGYSEIAGLENGADDYITKPIRLGVLKTRINSLINRTIVKDTGEETQFGELRVSLELRVIYKGNRPIYLPKKEFDLFAYLLSKPGRLFTRDEIFTHVWGTDKSIGKRTIDVHIRKLREKLSVSYIKTIRGVGYKLEIEEEV
jgi:two-component system alkaline phosphatase synthesis response regulator PhoP|tara:strand:+ start:1843 stop:2520 length:678 start_codon:yes stop_codon:yes gene_type:complete